MNEIEGVLPVVPTPFVKGAFDPQSFQAMLDHMIDEVDGYTLLGSTGEAPSMTVHERMQIAEQAIDMTPPDKKVIVGITTTVVADAVELATHAQSAGAAGLLCAAPYYFTNSANGVLSYLQEIDAAIDLDIIFYDNPAATKTKVSAEDVIHWAEQLRNLRTVKLTDHDTRKIGLWQDAGLSVIGGDDPILYEYLAAGVDGVMVIAPLVFPKAFRGVWREIQGGDELRALEILAREILPFIHVFGIGREIATTKALLADIGVFSSGELRPPLQPVSAARCAALRRAYDLGVSETERRCVEEGSG
ncbi:MAG: dihydrodipicolinate synthase family protein [Solirubrobacterales bacterium]